jgi:hypothetical protein
MIYDKDRVGGTKKLHRSKITFITYINQDATGVKVRPVQRRIQV